jgi:hypothetical protein
MGARFADLQRARDAVLAEAQALRSELEPALGTSLRAGIERVLTSQAGHVDRMDGPTRRALGDALAGATAAAVTSVIERLRDPEIWLSPHTAPDLPPMREQGWPFAVPAWLAQVLRARPPGRPRLDALDDAGNRIWVAIGSAAASIDPVLLEFGFEPVPPRIGGGRFGVVPRALPRLDPSGALGRRWRRYRSAFERYESLARVRG